MAWWTRFRTLLRQHQRNRKTIICIDANAGIGELQPYCGSVYQQEVDTAGRELHNMLQTFDLAVPSTFEEIHRGPSETWYSAKATVSGNRNDYVILSRDLLASCLLSEVMPNIDAGNQAVDHLAVTVLLDWETTSHRPPTKKINWDRDKILKADEDTWNRFFEDWPQIPWNTNLTTHMTQLENYLHERMAIFFPRDPQQSRNSCLDVETLDLLKQKQQIKKVLCASKQNCDRYQLHEALRCWKAQDSYKVRIDTVLCTLRTTWRWSRYKVLSLKIKQTILQTRADWLDKQLEPLARSNKKSALTILKPLRMGKRVKDFGKKPLQQVRLPDDQLASSPEEACERWRNYFAELEGGKAVTTRDLWDEAMTRLRKLPPPPDNITELPTLLEVERQLQHAAMGKGLGCDRLPGELLRMAAPWLARAVWPVVVKTALWCDEPLQHKGGRLVVAYKNKGDFTRCQNHRGLLVSSSLGKSLHNVWRAKTQRYVYKGASAMQFTAQPHALVTQAAHCVRLFLRSHSMGCSYVLFLDIQAAYYRLLRQHSIQSDFTDESIIAFLRRMGISDVSIPDLAALLQGPTALDELQCPEHLKRVVSSLHQSTWWKLDFDDRIIRTERGTRPGDGFADVIWQLCFSRFLCRLDDCLEALGIHCHLQWNQCVGFNSAVGEHDTPVGTVVWADDAAVMGAAPNADAVTPQLRIVTEVVLTELHKMGMEPNMGVGKTEAILQINGKACRRVRQFVHHHCHSRIQISVPGDADMSLRIVPTYVHLGGVLAHNASMKVEIRRKLAVANSTLDNYRAKVLNNAKVSLNMRVHIYKATVALALGYNLGTWPNLNKGELQMWTGGVMRLYRRLLLRHYSAEEQFHMTEGRLLAILQLPHPQDLLHAARLRHFAMCLRRDNLPFWALVGHDQEWLNTVRVATTWMYEQLRGLTVLPEPSTSDSLLQWQAMMSQEERKFNGLLKRAQTHAMMQRAIHADVSHFHMRIFKILRDGGLRLRDPPPPEEVHGERHRCIICHTEWSNFRAWAVHSFKRHGRLSVFRRLQEGTKCDACGRTFSSHTRLTRHFRSVTQCAETMAAQQRWSPAQPAMGSRIVTDQMPQDSMVPYIDTNGPVLPTRHGWAMTEATREALRLISIVDWGTTTNVPMNQLQDALQQLPLHHSEFEAIMEAQRNYYREQEAALRAINRFTEESRNIFGRRTQTTYVEATPQPAHLVDLSQLVFERPDTKMRGSPRFRYVLHLFAGAKRPGDFHSAIGALAEVEGAFLFPISLDVILDPVKGDLLSDEVQSFWLRMVVSGMVLATLAGPPCETWSISRWRQLEDGSGPRPLRSTDDLHLLIWSLTPLRIRELRQTTVGNKLLQFAILMMGGHAISGTLGILEHPSAPDARPTGVPASIWRLPIVQLMRQHDNVGLTHIKQGYFGARSPKPTTLMVVGRPHHRREMLKVLYENQTTTKLPPPLRMERTKQGFSTMPLKRYPPGLCTALAKMIHCGAASIPTLSNDLDEIYDIAEHFQLAYDATTEGVDGNDYFCGEDGKRSRCDN